jgi:hypothetical protein
LCCPYDSTMNPTGTITTLLLTGIGLGLLPAPTSHG